MLEKDWVGGTVSERDLVVVWLVPVWVKDIVFVGGQVADADDEVDEESVPVLELEIDKERVLLFDSENETVEVGGMVIVREVAVVEAECDSVWVPLSDWSSVEEVVGVPEPERDKVGELDADCDAVVAVRVIVRELLDGKVRVSDEEAVNDGDRVTERLLVDRVMVGVFNAAVTTTSNNNRILEDMKLRRANAGTSEDH